MRIEKFKSIRGYEGVYEVSNHGRVKSLITEWRSGNNAARHKEETILKLSINIHGYSQIILRNKSYRVHQLVWDTFGGKPRDGRRLQIDHIDNDKLNNGIDNLQLLTARQNTIKYYKTRKNSSKYIGVSWRDDSKKWRAGITIGGKKIWLGSFNSEVQARLAYQKRLLQIESREIVN